MDGPPAIAQRVIQNSATAFIALTGRFCRGGNPRAKPRVPRGARVTMQNTGQHGHGYESIFIFINKIINQNNNYESRCKL